ncbi:MAG: hypothetical protein ACOCRK_07705, partial [bacterium]
IIVYFNQKGGVMSCEKEQARYNLREDIISLKELIETKSNLDGSYHQQVNGLILQLQSDQDVFHNHSEQTKNNLRETEKNIRKLDSIINNILEAVSKDLNDITPSSTTVGADEE